MLEPKLPVLDLAPVPPARTTKGGAGVDVAGEEPGGGRSRAGGDDDAHGAGGNRTGIRAVILRAARLGIDGGAAVAAAVLEGELVGLAAGDAVADLGPLGGRADALAGGILHADDFEHADDLAVGDATIAAQIEAGVDVVADEEREAGQEPFAPLFLLPLVAPLLPVLVPVVTPLLLVLPALLLVLVPLLPLDVTLGVGATTVNVLQGLTAAQKSGVAGVAAGLEEVPLEPGLVDEFLEPPAFAAELFEPEVPVVVLALEPPDLLPEAVVVVAQAPMTCSEVPR